jgi:hypothetical protein
MQWEPLRKEKFMRLSAQAKMGYYPTPEDVTPIIAKSLKRKREDLIRIWRTDQFNKEFRHRTRSGDGDRS